MPIFDSHSCVIMNVDSERIFSGRLQEYLDDLLYSYRQWSMRFTPLTIDPYSFDPARERVVEGGEVRRGMGIVEAERALRRFILIGEPGAGKTTALQYLSWYYAHRAADILAENSAHASQSESFRIPVFIELNLYRPSSNGNGIVKMITGRLYPYSFLDNLSEVVVKLLLHERLLVILDGLNEIPRMYRRQAAADVQEFLQAYPNAHVIISCRSRDYPGIFRLSVLSVRALDRRAAEIFVSAALLSHGNIGAKAAGQRARTLINILYDRHRASEYSPLLLSIAAQVFSNTHRDVPHNRGRLFHNFFERWFRRESVKIRSEASAAHIMLMFQAAGALACRMHNLGELRASRESAWSFFGSLLSGFADNMRIGRGEYSAEGLLEEMLGMGLLSENDGKIKFGHQLYQEFFAGYHLSNENPREAASRLGRAWWEEPLKFYAGLTNNATPLVSAALKNGDALHAAGLLSACHYCDRTVQTEIFRRLFELLFDKFSYNRRRAFDLLVSFPDAGIDALLPELIGAAESDRARETYSAIKRERDEAAGFKDTRGEGGEQAGDAVSDSAARYIGTPSAVLQEIETAVYESGAGHGARMLREAVETLGRDEIRRCLSHQAGSCRHPDRFLFAVWGLALVNEKRGVDVLVNDNLHETALQIFPDVLTDTDTVPLDLRILMNIVFSDETRRVWQLEIAQFDLLCLRMDGADRAFAAALETALDRGFGGEGRGEFLLQIFWDLNPGTAGMYMTAWLRRYLHAPGARELAEFLCRYGVDAQQVDEYIVLMHEAPEKLKPLFPELLAKSGTQKALGLLMNIIRDESNALAFRSAAVSALRWTAGPAERIFLEELRNSDVQEIYDPAYEALVEIDRRLEMEEKMLAAESADEMSIELLFDEEFEPAPDAPPLVTVSGGDMKSADINGTRVNFGPVSGRIFYFLAKNAALGRYHSVGDIQEFMEAHDLHLDDSAVRNRINDMRSRIRRALEGRIDPTRLLENARRIGYRLNADVEIR